MTPLNPPQTLDQARAAWKTRWRQAYSDTSAGIFTVVTIAASLLALAASGDLTDAAMLAACAGWVLTIPVVIAMPAFFAAGPYPSPANQMDGRMPVPVMVDVAERQRAAERAEGADLDERD